MKILVPNPELDRSAWLAARVGKITPSLAAAILGEDPNHSPLEAWMRIQGLSEPLKDNSHLKAGRRFERPTAEWWAEEEGVELLPSPGLIQHDEYDWLCGTPDYRYRNATGTIGGLEVKNYNSFAKDEWIGSIPVPEMTQLQLYLELMGLDMGAFAVCFGSSELLPFNVVRDQSYTTAVIEALDEWRKAYLLTNTPPPAEGRYGSDVKLYGRLHPQENGERIILDNEGVTAAMELERVRTQRLKLEKEEQAAKAILLQKIGDASYAVMPDGTGYHWQCQTINHQPKAAFTEERRVLIRRKRL